MSDWTDLPYEWQHVLGEYATGLLDAEDVWHVVDEFATAGRLPDPARLPVHPSDLTSAEEAALVREQAGRLGDLLRRFLGGALTADDLGADALDVLGLTDDDPSALAD